MRRITSKRLAVSLLGLAALAGGWFLLAPAALGGSTSYVVTDGSSMKPRLKAGDLVLVRRQGQYRVGEIVAYRSRQLHTIVLHRIVAREGRRYVFKGDHNNWLDSERPARDQLVGAIFLRLPGFGAKLKRAGTPVVVALLAGAGALLLAGGAGAAGLRWRRRRGGADAKGTRSSLGRAGQAAQSVLAGACCALLAFLALGAVAFSRPTQSKVRAMVPYRQQGAFSYAGHAPRGDVYPDGQVRTGEAAFIQLVDRLRIRFDYELHARAPHKTAGTAVLEAVVAGSNGWQRTLELQRPRAFAGDHVRLAATLALRPLESLLARVGTATGGDPNLSFTLTLLPQVRTEGTLAGRTFETGFTPRLSFALDQFQLRPLPAGADGQAAPPAPSGQASPFRPNSSGAVFVARHTTRTLSVHGLRASIATLRRAAVIGALSALCALLVACFLVLRGRHADEPARIEARYRRLLVPVASLDREPDIKPIKVASIEALAQLAERYQRLILHEQSECGHAYLVADDGLLYVYSVAPEAKNPAAPPLSSEPVPEGARGQAQLLRVVDPWQDGGWNESSQLGAIDRWEDDAWGEPGPLRRTVLG